MREKEIQHLTVTLWGVKWQLLTEINREENLMLPHLFVHPITKVKKNNYGLLTASWLQGCHLQLQSKALYSIWTDSSFWWLGCSRVGSWTASEGSKQADRMEGCLAPKQSCHMEESWGTFNVGNSSRAWTVRPTFTSPLSSRMWWGKQSLSCKTKRYMYQASFFFSPRQVL